MSQSSTISSGASLSGLIANLNRALEESQARTITCTEKILELIQPGVMQLNECYVEQNRLRQVVLAEDTSDEDKVKTIRRAILKSKIENSKLNFPEGTLEDEFLKDETNKQIFNESVAALLEKITECNNFFTKLGGVIADESLTNTVKLEKIENILVAS